MSSGRFVGVVGAGYWGKNLVRNLHELGSLHTICDSNPAVLDTLGRHYQPASVTTSVEEVLENISLLAVALASPAVTHYDLVKRFLLAGKDVFVEKPLALTVREGEELVDIARREGRVLMVGHLLQYHPAVVRLKELIDAGELGEIRYIYSNRLNIGKLRTEENVLWSFAPHDISVLLMLLGQAPLSVTSFGGAYLNPEIKDVTMTTLEFSNGVKGHIFVSWLNPFKEQKLVVVGSKAMAVFDDMSKEKLFIYPHTIEWKEDVLPVAIKADPVVVTFPAKEPLKEELAHFLDCITTRRSPRTDGEEGLRVLRILEAAKNSLASGSPCRIDTAGAQNGFFVHNSSYMDENVTMGEGSQVWHFCHLMKGARIGKGCRLGQNVVIGPGVNVGDRVKIQNNVSVYGGVTLEDDVFCGPSMVFTNVYNPRAFIERKHEFLPTLVKTGATIGANATIVCGATIGRYAMIGAGAVVKNDVPDYAVVAGVPAKQIGWACKCGTTLKFNKNNASCGYCGNEYRLKRGILTAVNEDA